MKVSKKKKNKKTRTSSMPFRPLHSCIPASFPLQVSFQISHFCAFPYGFATYIRIPEQRVSCMVLTLAFGAVFVRVHAVLAPSAWLLCGPSRQEHSPVLCPWTSPWLLVCSHTQGFRDNSCCCLLMARFHSFSFFQKLFISQ